MHVPAGTPVPRTSEKTFLHASAQLVNLMCVCPDPPLQTQAPARRIRRRMKLNGKNLPVLIRLLLICAVVATLAWELLERLLAMGGVALNLSLGPIGFDIQVISIFLQVNPGTILGVVPAVILFRRL